MEICCLEDCGDNSVRPVLVAPRCDAFYPCLPATCTKSYNCGDKPKPKQHHEEGCCRLECHGHSQGHSHGHSRSQSRSQGHHKSDHGPCPPPLNHQDCCYVRPSSPRPCCEPVKTKYIMPCYRYEDGRICNQPTLLMRRACEVAVGKRPRKKPYEESRFVNDADHQESRYIREDEEGNCCYHFERQRHRCAPRPITQCASCPQYCMEYPPGVTARPVPPPLPQNCYYYCCY